jgi:hypothetical protein
MVAAPLALAIEDVGIGRNLRSIKPNVATLS